jgi:Zn-dependent protease
MFVTLGEILDIVVMSLFVGYIFKDTFRKAEYHDYEPLRRFSSQSLDFENIKYAALITSPAIILHELGHKFTALSFGTSATFHAAYFWLILGAVMKLMNFNFIFFVPAFVSYSGVGLSNLQMSAIAFAGPFVNLMLYLASKYLSNVKHFSRNMKKAFLISSRINLFLFIFNLIPLPMFDGYHFFSNLIRAIF